MSGTDQHLDLTPNFERILCKLKETIAIVFRLNMSTTLSREKLLAILRFASMVLIFLRVHSIIVVRLKIMED